MCDWLKYDINDSVAGNLSGQVVLSGCFQREMDGTRWGCESKGSSRRLEHATSQGRRTKNLGGGPGRGREGGGN